MHGTQSIYTHHTHTRTHTPHTHTHTQAHTWEWTWRGRRREQLLIGLKAQALVGSGGAKASSWPSGRGRGGHQPTLGHVGAVLFIHAAQGREREGHTQQG